MATEPEPMRKPIGHSVIVGGIDGGQAPNRLDVDDNITADIIYETTRCYPSYKEMVDLETEAIWANYLTEENIEPDRLIQCKDANRCSISYGWATVIVDATTDPPRCEYWHPRIDGIGVQVIETSYRGFPLKIQINATFNESNEPMEFTVDHYPCETYEVLNGEDDEPSIEYIRDRPIPGQKGFFLIRNRGGKKGIRGPPEYLRLIRFIRKVADIVENYAAYAENQALGHLFVGVKDYSPQTRASIKAQYQSQPTHRKLTILPDQSWAEWVSPMNSAWDPWAMLEYIDKLIARATQMNKLMLEGDPSGNLSSSETAINNWESKTIEKQAYWIGQFRPIFIALGASTEVNFRPPAKPAFVSLMEGLLAARQAMEGLVAREDIVSMFNDYLQKHGHEEELHVASPEEQQQYNGGMDQNDNSEQSEDNNRD